MQKNPEGTLCPVGCVSTLQTKTATFDAEAVLQALVYSLRKFYEVVMTSSLITVYTAVPGLSKLLKSPKLGARLQALVSEV